MGSARRLIPAIPAGLPRMMTLDLTSKARSVLRCVLRISTNMECYWDQAFVALPRLEVIAVQDHRR